MKSKNIKQITFRAILCCLLAVVSVFTATQLGNHLTGKPDDAANVLPDDRMIRVENAGVAGLLQARSLTTDNLDQFGMFVTNSSNSTYTYENVQMSKSIGTWHPSVTMLWQNADTAVDVVAYAPYVRGSTLNGGYNIAVKEDQSAEKDFIASDFIWAKSAVTPSSPVTTNDIYYNADTKKLNVTLEHQLAKVNVTVTLTGNMANGTVEYVHFGDVAMKGTFNLGTGTLTPETYDYLTADQYIKMYQPDTDELNYEAIFVPSETAPFVTVHVGDKDYTYFHPDKFTFEAGKEYTFNLSVGKEIMLVEDVSIADWTTGTAWNGEAINN